MDKYIDLEYFLLHSQKEEITITFSEIEQILSFSLPRSAYVHKAWWANGGHTQANAWLNADYKVSDISLEDKTVVFVKTNVPINRTTTAKQLVPQIHKKESQNHVQSNKNMMVLGYEFAFLQAIMPLCDDDYNIIKFYPQEQYDNKNELPLSKYGTGAFCRFSIDSPQTSGVYLWVVDNKIIYIGETENLSQRFNVGYGNISPRNCYVGGQNTNCKMNKIVLELYEQGKIIDLYFYETKDYKMVELDLLRNINTPYNVKDNKK